MVTGDRYVDAAPKGRRNFQYYDLVMAAFVAVLICSNVIGAAKVCSLWGIHFGAGVLFFPISYIFGDILTEVYGYARSRRVVWAGFAAMGFVSFMSWFVIQLPPAEGWPNQAAFETVFGGTWRIALASLTAYLFGEFTNSITLAKMKIATRGRFLWSRILGSTVLGEAIDTVIFYPLAFYGLWPKTLVVQVMVTSYLIKVGWELLMTPVTYRIVAFLKRVEQEDFFDYDTKFTPFSIKT